MRVARIFIVAVFVVAPVWSQTTPIRQEILTVFDGAAKRAFALAEAMPLDKFAWRPMKGVRSYGEVCMHMAGSNFLFLSYAGLKPPSGPAQELAAAYMKRGFELPELFAVEGAIKEKAKIVAAMKQSFDQAREFIQNVPEADLDKTVQFFDRKTTIRGILISMSGHLSEHLGQAIAYARVNHVVPPWSR